MQTTSIDIAVTTKHSNKLSCNIANVHNDAGSLFLAAVFFMYFVFLMDLSHKLAFSQFKDKRFQKIIFLDKSSYELE